MDAYEAAQDSMAQVALRFGVGQATVNRWVNCHRRTGRLEPLPHAGGSTAKVDEVGLSLLCLLSRSRRMRLVPKSRNATNRSGASV